MKGEGARSAPRPPPDADLHARLCAGRTATIERIFVDVDGKVHLGVTVDGDRLAQELLRETAVPVLLRTRGGGGLTMPETRPKRILVAGIGNAWMRDDGFAARSLSA